MDVPGSRLSRGGMDFSRNQVKADCVELLGRFQKTESVRFQIFSQIWREMKFSQISHGIVSDFQKRAFSRLLLETACSFFMPPYSFQIRVGGLYLLHSLYHCQTASPREQIRLALKDWNDVKTFEKDAVDAQHLDAVYILRQLMFHKALMFTAMPTLLHYKKKLKVQPTVLCEDFVERASRPQQLINIDLLEELSNIHELYGNLKTSLSSPLEPPDPSINLIRKDLVPRLRRTVVDFYKWQQREAGPEDDSGEGTSSQQECSRRAEHLAFIKSKAYGEAAEASKSRRHRQVEVDVTSNESGPGPSSRHSRKDRPSLKARTYGNLQISDEAWKEAMTPTRIHSLTTLDFGPEERNVVKKIPTGATLQ